MTRVTVVADRRLAGYEGLRVNPRGNRFPGLRVRVPHGGRWSLHLRLLGAPDARSVTLRSHGRRIGTRSAERAAERPIEIGYGRIRLRRGERMIRLHSPAPLTLDQVRLEPGR